MFSPKLTAHASKSTAGTALKHSPVRTLAPSHQALAPTQAPPEAARAVPAILFDFRGIPVLPPIRKPSFSTISERLGVREHSLHIRSDSAAVDLLNRNRAAAATVNDSTIFVRPEHRNNNVVLSHELVHVAQLRRGRSGSVQQSEHAADAAALALLRGVTPANVGLAAPLPLFKTQFTGGAFDQALDNAGVRESVHKRLSKSSAFMKIVRTLDSHYVALGNSALKSTDKTVNGVLKSGAFAGKRILFIQGGSEAGVFMPFGSPDTAIGSDLIKINNGASDFELIRTIAHEATHAFRYVTGANAPKDPLLGDDKPEKVEAAIQAGVTEELETRKSEINITEGLYKKGSKERSTLQQEVKAGYLSRPLIERDIAPEIGLTYLENSGFAALLEEARLTEHLSQEQATQLRDKIDTGHMKRIPTTKDRHGFEEPSKYALAYKNRQIAIATWQQFKQQFQDRMDSEEAQKEKERILQENAHVLLDNRIHYSPLPKS